jgi:hypothetical protein
VKLLYTERFLIRDININDANSTYLSWLQNNEASKYIVTSSDIEGLKRPP